MKNRTYNLLAFLFSILFIMILNGNSLVYAVDSDLDGVPDQIEDINQDENLDNDDTDSDGIPNYLDDDDDGDGLLTANEDTNEDGDFTNDDFDNDGIPEYLDNSCGECPSTGVDPDGHVYKVVQIGEQCWMAENYRYLPEIHDGDDKRPEPRYYVYDDYGTDLEEAKATENYLEYGALYNWYAVLGNDPCPKTDTMGIQGICPTGWRVPGHGDFNTLNNFLGENAGAKLREVGTEHWNNPYNASNETGFTALPGGENELFYGGMGYKAIFWTSDARNEPWGPEPYFWEISRDEFYNGTILQPLDLA